MRRFLPTGLQMMTCLRGGIGLLGAIAGLLAVYRNLKFGPLARFGRGDLSADRDGRYRRSEQYSLHPVLKLG